jgi:hypothetical protein
MHVGKIVEALDLRTHDQPRLVGRGVHDNAVGNIRQRAFEIGTDEDEVGLFRQALL